MLPPSSCYEALHPVRGQTRLRVWGFVLSGPAQMSGAAALGRHRELLSTSGIADLFRPLRQTGRGVKRTPHPELLYEFALGDVQVLRDGLDFVIRRRIQHEQNLFACAAVSPTPGR